MPGGPANRRWSTACPRWRAAPSRMSRCSFSCGWPTNSSSRRGRSVVSSAASTGSAPSLGLASARPRHATSLTLRCSAAQALERGAEEVADRAVVGEVAAARRGPRRGCSRARSARRAPRPARSVRDSPPGSTRSRSGTPRRFFSSIISFCAVRFPTPGTRQSASRSSSATQRRSARRRVHREHREPELRADAARADQDLERVALVAGREPVERHRVLADVEVREQERLRRRARAPGIAPSGTRHR